jgi:GT2 family glycosyltransferase
MKKLNAIHFQMLSFSSFSPFKQMSKPSYSKPSYSKPSYSKPSYSKPSYSVTRVPPGLTADDIAELLAVEFPAPQRPSVPVLNGFCSLFRSNAIRHIGLLDEKRFPKGYGEENDYCLRLTDAGYRLLVCEDAYVYHVKSASFGHETRVKLSRAGGKNFVKKHGQSRLDEMVAGFQDNRELSDIRERVSRAFERRFGKVR